RRHEGPGIETLTRAAYEDGIVGLGGDEGDFISVVDVVPPVDGRPWNRPYLQDVVGEIDERTFTNVMAFGLDELHELRTLEPEGCGSRLYELAAGLDRSKVTRVIGHIHESLARLDSADPAVSPIESLRLRRHELLDRIAALNSPDNKARLDAQGFEVVANTSEQFTEFLKGELARWKQVVDTAGIKPD
ncbi:MAG: hypothetical protein EBS65_23520, partial [Betaproteobacteria bacterium]|nr:hypothetical protein [Betaproteobacteria bacterium]